MFCQLNICIINNFVSTRSSFFEHRIGAPIEIAGMLYITMAEVVVIRRIARFGKYVSSSCIRVPLLREIILQKV